LDHCLASYPLSGSSNGRLAAGDHNRLLLPQAAQERSGLAFAGGKADARFHISDPFARREGFRCDRHAAQTGRVGRNIRGGLLARFLVPYITRFQIIPEEHMMRSKFGDEYMEYQKRVRRWI
jgi:hypothetical protein